MPKLLIDPTNMSHDEELIVLSLLKPNKDLSVNETFPVTYLGRKYDVSLKYNLKYNPDAKNPDYIVELEELGRGAEGVVKSAAKLKIVNGKIIYKPKTFFTETEYVMKRENISGKSEATNRQKLKTTLASRVPHLGMKNTTNQKVGSTYQIETLMRRAQGKTIDKFFKDPQLTDQLKIELSKKILQAAQEQVFDLGIVHRDLKAINIMASIDYKTNKVQVEIIDFDMMKEQSFDDSSEEIIGTPRYHAPEVGVGFATSQKSDIFAIGQTLGGVWETSKNKKEVQKIIDQICAENPNDRISIKKAIKLFNEIEPLYNQQLDKSQSAVINQANILATDLRYELSALKTQKHEINNINDILTSNAATLNIYIHKLGNLMFLLK